MNLIQYPLISYKIKQRHKISRYLIGKIRFQAHWRCAEPVIIFESDDWGFNRKACTSLLRKYGIPGPWAEEQLETEEDLEALYRILEQYRDPNGRPACFVANFIVKTPDYYKIQRYRYERYIDIPIFHVVPERLIEKWREGLTRKVFIPSYHGRSHFCSERWLEDLRSDVPGARDLAASQCLGGLSLLKDQGWRYHSEYLDWQTGKHKPFQELLKWVSDGVQYFYELFGYFPKDTIAPHYISTPLSRQVFRTVGIRYLQGMNYQLIRLKDGNITTLGSALGSLTAEGLLSLTRNVKFEPRPQRPANHLPSAWQQIEFAFQNHIPAIVDTHRINYVGSWRNQSLASLSNLLSMLEKYKPIILTTSELAKAIENNGCYKDIFSDNIINLTVLYNKSVAINKYLLDFYNKILCKTYF